MLWGGGTCTIFLFSSLSLPLPSPLYPSLDPLAFFFWSSCFFNTRLWYIFDIHLHIYTVDKAVHVLIHLMWYGVGFQKQKSTSTLKCLHLTDRTSLLCGANSVVETEKHPQQQWPCDTSKKVVSLSLNFLTKMNNNNKPQENSRPGSFEDRIRSRWRNVSQAGRDEKWKCWLFKSWRLLLLILSCWNQSSQEPNMRLLCCLPWQKEVPDGQTHTNQVLHTLLKPVCTTRHQTDRCIH